MHKMISVEEALRLVEEYSQPLKAKVLSLQNFTGKFLAEDVFSPINMPPFNQSAMDGYALHYSDQIESYTVIGEIAAGDTGQFELKAGEAVRIFTGALVPESANTVVKQEIVEREGDQIKMTEPIAIGQNIRLAGEQIKQGELALKKGSHLSAPAVGFLSGLGLNQLNCIPHPSISIIATGSELVKPGTPLSTGKIYESNSYMLAAGLKQYGFTDFDVIQIEDTYESTKKTIQQALETKDILILSGGISVGDYDFVGKALNEIGVEQIFYKVRQKPGKPLFFGRYKEKYIFALPGNPAAAMTSFLTYILPALGKISGAGFIGLRKDTANLDVAFHNKANRSVFLKAYSENGKVKLLDGQSSAILKSLSEANCFVYVPAGVNEILEGDEVDILWL
jgi:molybdopterin molybdotransferase